MIGIPEFDFPRLDPLFYGYSKAAFNRGEIYGELTVLNVIVTGLKNIHFLTLRSHFYDDSYRFEVDVKISRLIVDGDSNAIGSLGGIRMGGKGTKINSKCILYKLV